MPNARTREKLQTQDWRQWWVRQPIQSGTVIFEVVNASGMVRKGKDF